MDRLEADLDRNFLNAAASTLLKIFAASTWRSGVIALT